MATTIRYICRDEDVWMTGGVPRPPFTGEHETRRTSMRAASVISVCSLDVAPIDRCIAARALPQSHLTEIFTKKHAARMAAVAFKLAPDLHADLRAMRVGMNVLFWLATFDSHADQREQYEAKKIADAEKANQRKAPKRRRRRAAPARVIRTVEALLEQVGAPELRRLLASRL